MAIRITLECGHASVLRGRTTPAGYTHDWEVFVRGVDNADISHYVEKVVFQLHETFPKPKRILKEPPYVVKESGYAGFVIPIYICFKNKDEPKRIQILYDLQLQQSGPAINNFIRQSEVFTNPTDDFRRKLLKGGGVIVSNSEEGPDKSELKVAMPMIGKPKLSGIDGKKHRLGEPKTTNTFTDLFGSPFKSVKVSPENKKLVTDKTTHKISPDKLEKSEKLNKTKHSPHKDSKREKNGEEKKEKKDRDQSKEKERSKEKSKRPPSPSNKNSYQSPNNKRPQSPVTMKKQSSPLNSLNNRKSASPKIRDAKDHKKILVEKDKDKEKAKDNAKIVADDLKSDKKKKKHKDEKVTERKDKVRDKEREKVKDLKSSEKKNLEKLVKHDKPDKEKSQESKSSKDIKKSPKQLKDSERSNSKIRSEKSEITEKIKDSTRNDKERQKHKHRKKEKKERTDESKERDKRDKRDKQVHSYDKDSASSVPPTSNPISTLLTEVHDRDNNNSDSANSADEEDSKTLTSYKTEQKPVKNSTSDSRLSRPLSPSGSEHVKRERPEKIKKDKLKPLRGEERDNNKKRKRRSDSKGGDDEVPAKREKDAGFSPPLEPVSSSQSPVTVEMAAGYTAAKEPDDTEHHAIKQKNFETEPEQIAPDSTNNILVESESDEPLVFSEDYVSQLKDLQQKIMTLQDNEELQRVVQVIAATGQYEITRKTFDFDLCALDRRTVQRLQQFFSAS